MLPSAKTKGVGFHVALDFGAQSHGLFARCLRFAAFLPGCPVVRPRKTRFRLVVSLCRTGSRPLGSLVKFPLHLHRFLLTQALPGALMPYRLSHCAATPGAAHSECEQQRAEGNDLAATEARDGSRRKL